MLGIGTDILQISRIHDTLERHGEKFAQRILTVSEMIEYRKHYQPERMLAKRFAIKEAVSKALGTGIGEGVSWQHIEVVHDELGAPAIVLSGRALEIARSKGGEQVIISGSDEKEYVVAFAVLLPDRRS
tara:strand:+ start:35 stop:421 length:387 start_codon:yes stop_codon:yes gene_type:complete